MLKKSLFLMLNLALFSSMSYAASNLEKCKELFDGHQFDKAFAPCKKAAEQGDADAQFHMAFMYGNGEGVAQNEKKAFSWGRKAAEQGHADAQYNLSQMYDGSEVVARDEKKADYWYQKSFESNQKAAAEGNAAAQYNLANMYQYSRKKEPDYQLAYMWAWLAAKQEYLGAEMNVKDTKEKLTPEQLAQAQKMAEECLATNYKHCGK